MDSVKKSTQKAVKKIEKTADKAKKQVTRRGKVVAEKFCIMNNNLDGIMDDCACTMRRFKKGK